MAGSPNQRPEAETRDLDRQVRSLIHAWRSGAGKPSDRSPADSLTHDEMRAVTGAVRALTRGLGATRTLAGARYMDDPSLLGGYLLYFWPVSYAQVRYCLGKAGLAQPPLRCLDLGCGPGAAVAALIDSGARTVVAADLSRGVAELARDIAGRGAAVTPVRWDAERSPVVPLQAAPYDCIVCSHLLNELWKDRDDRIERRASLVDSMLAALGGDGVAVIVEPALRMPARDLLALRDRCVGRGAFVAAPCTMQDRCPAQDSAEGSCFASVPWNPPRLLREIASSAGPHRDELKMAYLVLRRHAPATGRDDAVQCVVSDPLLNKAGRVRMLVCGAKGRMTISADPRDPYPAVRVFLSLHRGQNVRILNPLARGESWAVGPQTKVVPVP